MRFFSFSVLTTLVGLSFSSTFAGAGHRHHSAHTHGEAELQISREAEVLKARLKAPAGDFLSFDGVVKSEDQKKEWESLQKKVQDGGVIFSFSDQERCGLKSFSPEILAVSESEHADVILNFQWRCSGDGSLNIDVAAFSAFPSLKKIKAQWIDLKGQSSKVLKNGSQSLEIR